MTKVKNDLISSQFAINVFFTTAVKILSFGIGGVVSIMISRALGPSARGEYAAAIALAGIGAQFGNLGLHASNSYYLAKEPHLLPTLAANSIAVSFIIGLGISSIFGALLTFYPTLSPVSGTLLLMSLLSIPLALTLLLLQNLLLGLQRVRTINYLELLASSLALISTIVVVVITSATAKIFYASGLVIQLLVCIVVFRCLRISFVKPSFSLLKRFVPYGLRAYLAALFMYSLLKFDILMVQHLLGYEQTGLYVVAVSVTELVYMFPSVVSSLLFPKLSSMAESSHRWFVTKRVVKVVIVLMIGIILITSIFSSEIIRLLFGAPFLPASTALNFLLPGIFFLSVNTVFMNYFASMGMPAITVYSPLCAGVINILLNLWFIPYYGITGAAISSSIAYFFMCIVSIVYIARRNNL